MIPKFRAWVKSESRMISSEKIASLDFLKKKISESKIFANKDGSLGVVEYTYHNFDDVELMQSTGVKDINGVEIYEGDIVEWKHIRMCVSGLLEVKRDFPMWLVKHDEFEVIGNIYENSDLLEVE